MSKSQNPGPDWKLREILEDPDSVWNRLYTKGEAQLVASVRVSGFEADREARAEGLSINGRV